MLVRLKFVVGRPVPKLATTLYEPTVPLAVNTGAVATPLPFVTAFAVVTLPGNVPLGPLPGAVKVAVIPLIGLPDSVTVACSCVGKGVLGAVSWGVQAGALHA